MIKKKILFFTNYRDDVKLNSKEDERQFIFSLVHNLELRYMYSIVYYFVYKKILYNNNENLIDCRNQFYLADSLEFIFIKTKFFEDSVNEVYNYLKILIKRKMKEKKYLFSDGNTFLKILKFIFELNDDINYFSKLKMKALMTEKISFIKKIIDIIGLYHNVNEYKSLLPHPPFQNRYFADFIGDTERILVSISGILNCYIEWKNIEKLKEVYQYIIYKILNQEKEDIKKLEDNEFSYHLGLYRSFGIFINNFCFNYSFINNCSLLESINFFKKSFFESQEQVENIVDIILKDIFKFFGFICGVKNNYFNYYENIYSYFKLYTEQNLYQFDFTLIKYLLALTEKKIDINSFLKFSNIENTYEKFDNIFNLGIFAQNITDSEKNI